MSICYRNPYLRSRKLTEEIWRTYRLGYGRTFHPLRQTNMEAIFIPWFTRDEGEIIAIQHRFLDPSVEKGERYTFKPGSQLVVFGLQALARAQTLVVVEGEFNCMALHQSGAQAISVGSEANTLGDTTLDALGAIIPNYERTIVWFDDLAKGKQLAERLRETTPFRKENIRAVTHTSDANDLLLAGELAAFVERLK